MQHHSFFRNYSTLLLVCLKQYMVDIAAKRVRMIGCLGGLPVIFLFPIMIRMLSISFPESQASWSAGGRWERLWGNEKNVIF